MIGRTAGLHPMVQAIKQTVTIQAGGRIEISSDQLPAGQQAEVIILLPSPATDRKYADAFGTGTGCFATPEAVDEFIRRERDSWEN